MQYALPRRHCFVNKSYLHCIRTSCDLVCHSACHTLLRSKTLVEPFDLASYWLPQCPLAAEWVLVSQHFRVGPQLGATGGHAAYGLVHCQRSQCAAVCSASMLCTTGEPHHRLHHGLPFAIASMGAQQYAGCDNSINNAHLSVVSVPCANVMV